MFSNLNPFEPWRPREARQPAPPVVDARRPWRPPMPEPPFALPVEPKPAPRARRELPVPRPAHTRQRPTPPPAELRPDQRALALLFPGLVVLGLAGLIALGGTHLPRVFLALLSLGAGCLIGISLRRQRPWYARLGWVASGLAGAALAGWFAPTTSGLSLWGAYQRLAAAEAIPPGNVAAYTQGQAGRRELVREFPTFREAVETAELSWLRRTVDTAIEQADVKLETDPEEASETLQKLTKDLNGLEHFDSFAPELLGARKRAVQARLEQAVAEVKGLLGKGRFADVADVAIRRAAELRAEAEATGEEPKVTAALRELRRKAAEARLEAARKETDDLLAHGGLQAAAVIAESLARDMGDEARRLGLGDELEKFRTDLARHAGKPASK
jgi:hypothetical protein